jgi:tetratricopeptide (TPR) repeat protein
LTANGQPKITDFGLAKRLEMSSGRTATDAFLGTPSYAAPEQARGDNKRVGPPADIYALGAILYECLTGRPPFKAPTPLETLAQVCLQEPVPPRKLQPKVPRDLETICLKCLHKESSRRYASGQALAADLRRFLNGEPIWGRPVGPVERVTRWAKRRPATVGLILVTTLAAIGLTIFYLNNRSSLEKAAQVALEDKKNAFRIRLGQLRNALNERKWKDGFELATELAYKVGLDPAFEIFKPEVETALRHAAENRIKEMRISQAVTKYEVFTRAHGDALMYSALPPRDGVVNNLQKMAEAAWNALAIYQVTQALQTEPQVDPLLDAEKVKQARDGCYELLLILAEAKAEPPAGEAADVKGALEILQLADRFGPPTKAILLRRARYLRKAGADGPVVQKAEQQAEGFTPTVAMDYYLLGDDHYKHDRIDKAIKSFDAATLKQPDFFWARYALAVCYLHQEQYAVAKGILSSCWAERPDFIWAQLMLGFALGQLEEYDQAEKVFEDAKGKDSQLTEEMRYALYSNRGYMRLRRERQEWYVAAKKDLQDARILKPDQYHALIGLAIVNHRLGHKVEAKELFDEALRRGPKNGFIYRLRAKFYQQTRNPKEACDDLEEAMARDQQNVLPEEKEEIQKQRAEDLVLQGRLLRDLKRYSEAKSKFQEARQCNRDLALAHLAYAEIVLEDPALAKASSQRQRQAYHDAIAAYESYFSVLAKAAQVPSAKVYNDCGKTRTRIEDWSGAARDFSRAHELMPALETLMLRGRAYLASHAMEAALGDFNEVVKLDPKHQEAHLGRYICHLSLGHFRDVAKDLEETPPREIQPNGAPAAALSASFLLAGSRIFAQSIEKAAADQPILRLRERTKQNFRKQSVLLLGDSLATFATVQEKHRFWKEQIESDRLLNPIRDTNDFQRWHRLYSKLAGDLAQSP